LIAVGSTLKIHSGERIVRIHICGPIVAAHDCYPSYVGGIDRLIVVLGWPWQNYKTLSEKQLKQKGLEE
jgi:hypothetical protein